MPAEAVDKSQLFGQIGPVLLATFSHFFGSLVIFPFVPFMVKDFLNVARTRIGFYSGFLISSYHVGVFLGSLLWGSLADRWGRRPALLLSMFCMLVFMLFFGFSRTFAWAVVARFMWGVSSGVLTVGKTILIESSNNKNTARVFSFLGVSGGLGRLLGPAVGGILSQPAQKFPALDVPFFREFPYLLPILISFFIMLSSFVWSLFYMRETLHQPPRRTAPAEAEETGERFELLSAESRADEPVDIAVVEEKEVSPTGRSLRQRLVSALPFCRPGGGFQRMTDSDQEDSDRSAAASCIGAVKVGLRDYALSFGLLRNKVIRHSCTLYALLAFLAIMHNEVIPLLLVVSFMHGGLCMNTAELGILSAGFGIGHLVVQLFCFPRLVKRFGYRKVFRAGLLGFCLFFFLIPWITSFTGNQDPHLVYDSVGSDGGGNYNESTVFAYENSTVTTMNLYRRTTNLDNHTLPEACVRHVVASANATTASVCSKSGGAATSNVTSSSSFQFDAVPCLPYYVWLLSLLIMGGSYWTRTVSFTSINIIINNSCDRDVRARVNAIGTAMASVGRILGPLIVSNLFAWSVSEDGSRPYPLNHHLTFVMVAIMAICSVLWSWGLPESVETRMVTAGAAGSEAKPGSPDPVSASRSDTVVTVSANGASVARATECTGSTAETENETPV